MFALIGGKPFRCYTGTTTYTGLSVVAKCNTKKQAEKLYRKHYEDCGGLLLIVDLDTGDAADMVSP